MADHNLSRLLKRAFRRARDIYDDDPIDEEALDATCQKLLEEARIPLHWRVCIHMMLAHISNELQIAIDMALVYLDEIEKQVVSGRMSVTEASERRDYVDVNRPELMTMRETLPRGRYSAQSENEDEIDVDESNSEVDIKSLTVPPESGTKIATPITPPPKAQVLRSYLPSPPATSPLLRSCDVDDLSEETKMLNTSIVDRQRLDRSTDVDKGEEDETMDL